MPGLSQPRKHTMLDDNALVQRQVEERTGTRPCIWQNWGGLSGPLGCRCDYNHSNRLWQVTMLLNGATICEVWDCLWNCGWFWGWQGFVKVIKVALLWYFGLNSLLKHSHPYKLPPQLHWHDSCHVPQWQDMYLTAPQTCFLMPQPNKTKLPLQVLAVVKGNNEKMRFRIMW